MQLDGADRLTRASMALRGFRPTLDEYERLEDDPDAFEAIVDEYVHSRAFTHAIVEWANEVFLARTETIPLPPAVGQLSQFNQAEIYEAATGEPMRLVQHIVNNDRPFTELVTADYMIANELLSKMWGVPWNPEGEEWQVSHWTDGRPPAGILSSAWLMVRYQSAGANFHRTRADMLAETLLCESFNTRDVSVGGDVNISDELEVAEAVRTDPVCVGCHQAMDPLAGFFWGYKPVIRRFQIIKAVNSFDCYWDFAENGDLPPDFDTDIADFCYPLRQYFPEQELDWMELGLREPSFYAQPAQDMADVGQLIADDPRFSSCMSKRLFSYLTTADLDSVPADTTLELQARFEESNFDIRELAKAVVLTDAFSAGAVTQADSPDAFARMRPVRPWQFAATLEDLTGYRWLADVDSEGCGVIPVLGNTCWGAVDLLESDLYGFRSMQGGIDSYYTVKPEHTVTPTKFLAMEAVAYDAARYVVDNDLDNEKPHTRRLLRLVEAEETDEAAIRAQMASLFHRMHGMKVAHDGEDVDLLYGLFSSVLPHSGTRDAWTVTIAALLQDPRMVFN